MTSALYEKTIIRDFVPSVTPRKKETENTSKNDVSIADAIKEYKELFDLGIITQEEFDKKKSELL